MKRLIIISCTLFLSLFLSAQEDTIHKSRIGVNVSSSISGTTFFLNPNINYTIKRHSFYFGPTIMGLITNPYSNNISSRYRGIQGVYQFYPNKNQKIIDFYFQYDFIYHSFYANAVSWEHLNKVSEQYVGYGLKIKFLKNFYINQSIGVGRIVSFYSQQYVSPIYNDTKRRSDELSVIAKLGIGYRY